MVKRIRLYFLTIIAGFVVSSNVVEAQVDTLSDPEIASLTSLDRRELCAEFERQLPWGSTVRLSKFRFSGGDLVDCLSAVFPTEQYSLEISDSIVVGGINFELWLVSDTAALAEAVLSDEEYEELEYAIEEYGYGGWSRYATEHANLSMHFRKHAKFAAVANYLEKQFGEIDTETDFRIDEILESNDSDIAIEGEDTKEASVAVDDSDTSVEEIFVVTSSRNKYGSNAGVLASAYDGYAIFLPFDNLTIRRTSIGTSTMSFEDEESEQTISRHYSLMFANNVLFDELEIDNSVLDGDLFVDDSFLPQIFITNSRLEQMAITNSVVTDLEVSYSSLNSMVSMKSAQIDDWTQISSSINSDLTVAATLFGDVRIDQSDVAGDVRIQQSRADSLFLSGTEAGLGISGDLVIRDSGFSGLSLEDVEVRQDLEVSTSNLEEFIAYRVSVDGRTRFNDNLFAKFFGLHRVTFSNGFDARNNQFVPPQTEPGPVFLYSYVDTPSIDLRSEDIPAFHYWASEFQLYDTSTPIDDLNSWGGLLDPVQNVTRAMEALQRSLDSAGNLAAANRLHYAENRRRLEDSRRAYVEWNSYPHKEDLREFEDDIKLLNEIKMVSHPRYDADLIPGITEELEELEKDASEIRTLRQSAFSERRTEELRWIVWGWTTGYGTQPLRLTVIGVPVLFLFSILMWFFVPFRFDPPPPDKDRNKYSLHLLEGPPEVDNQTAHSGRETLPAAFAATIRILLKIGKDPIVITTTTLFARVYVWALWLLGYYVLILITFTLARSWPIANRLLTTIF